MELLNLQITNPMVLILATFAGGLLCGWCAWKLLRAGKAMILTVMMLPAVVCAALISINGSLGTGIAIMGVFGLVRFRSLPGTGTDIVSVFFAMVVGLMISTGYLLMAVLISLLLAVGTAVAVKLTDHIPQKYNLHILVPEDTEDLNIFTNILKQYGKKVALEKIRTTNMGSMYELVYSMEPDLSRQREMMDDIRIHNHNLNIAFGIARPDSTL